MCDRPRSDADPTIHHVRSTGCTGTHRWFAEAVERERPDAVICTGDITQRAKHREWQAAREWLAALPAPVVTEVGSDPHHAKRDREEHHSGNWGHTERRHAGSNLFRYRADGAMYMLNLETDRRMRGIYRLVVHLNDGGSFFMDVQLR